MDERILPHGYTEDMGYWKVSQMKSSYEVRWHPAVGTDSPTTSYTVGKDQDDAEGAVLRMCASAPKGA